MKKVLDVGQCDYDHNNIKNVVKDACNGSTVWAHTKEEALKILSGNPNEFSLVTINRLLDKDHSEGMETLIAIKNNPELSHIPVMIISDFEEAQNKAISAGGVKGFGKTSLKTKEARNKTVELVKNYLL